MNISGSVKFKLEDTLQEVLEMWEIQLHIANNEMDIDAEDPEAIFDEMKLNFLIFLGVAI